MTEHNITIVNAHYTSPVTVTSVSKCGDGDDPGSEGWGGGWGVVWGGKALSGGRGQEGAGVGSE